MAFGLTLNDIWRIDSRDLICTCLKWNVGCFEDTFNQKPSYFERAAKWPVFKSEDVEIKGIRRSPMAFSGSASSPHLVFQNVCSFFNTLGSFYPPIALYHICWLSTCYAFLFTGLFPDIQKITWSPRTFSLIYNSALPNSFLSASLLIAIIIMVFNLTQLIIISCSSLPAILYFWRSYSSPLRKLNGPKNDSFWRGDIGQIIWFLTPFTNLSSRRQFSKSLCTKWMGVPSRFSREIWWRSKAIRLFWRK